MSDGYSLLASYYQPISRLVFGKDLIYANQAFLEGLAGKKLLFIGGGDGVAYRDFRENLHGEYWDLSLKMTQIARQNLAGSSLIIQSGAWPGTGKFDRIYLPFVLDTMADNEISLLLLKIKDALLPKGEVVVSDFFQPLGLIKKVTQKAMIGFFRLATHHKRKDLPMISQKLVMAGFILSKEKVWRQGWIRSQVYELSPNRT